MRLSNRARVLTVAVCASVWLAMSGSSARATETAGAAIPAAPAAHAAAVKRSAASLNLNAASPISPPARSSGMVNAFVYSTGPQSLGFRGRVNVGKSGVYVPYYGNVDTSDPLHPAVQGVAGVGYGFHTFDVSVQNGAFSPGVAPPPPNVPGGSPAKVNPSLSFSIRF
jgi:hypothetical protein